MLWEICEWLVIRVERGALTLGDFKLANYQGKEGVGTRLRIGATQARNLVLAVHGYIQTSNFPTYRNKINTLLFNTYITAY